MRCSKKSLVWMLALFFVALLPSVDAVSTILAYPSINASKVRESSPTSTSNGLCLDTVQYVATTSKQRSYIYVDLANYTGIFSNVTEAYLYLTSRVAETMYYDYIFEVWQTQTWDENSITWNNQPCGTATGFPTDIAKCNTTYSDSVLTGTAVGSNTDFNATKRFNITSSIKNAIANSYKNVSFVVMYNETQPPAETGWAHNYYDDENNNSSQGCYLANGNNISLAPFVNITSTTTLDVLTITIAYPPNGSAINNISYPIKVNGTVTGNPTIANVTINSSSFQNIGTNSVFNFTPTSSLSDGTYTFMIIANDTNGNSYNSTVTFSIDTNSPTISARYELRNNLTVAINNTLRTQINFTDSIELYSVNITFSNGTILFNTSNIGATTYSLDINYGVDTTISNNISVKVCDAHTANEIDEVKVEKDGVKLNYIKKEEDILFGLLKTPTEWVKIYPKSQLDYQEASTSKKKDRYTFGFTKKSSFAEYETYVVESSSHIDIAQKQTYKGHLIIPELNYWVDFSNQDVSLANIRRISNNIVEVDIYGLQGTTANFESIGELNCVNQTFYFGNPNPQFTYIALTTTSTYNLFNLSINNDSLTMRNWSASLFYNNSATSAGSTANFSANISSPNNVSGNQQNVTFYWLLTINGIQYTLQAFNQTVQDISIDNCTLYSTRSINYTFYDESTTTRMVASIDGSYPFGLVSGSPVKTFTLDMNNINNFSICINPSNITLYSDYSLTYLATNYPQRSISLSATMTNLTQNVNLYLVSSTNGGYATFQITDVYNNLLDGVTATMQKVIDGNLVTVASLTSSSGQVSFLVDVTTNYYFTFVKTGYTTITLSNYKPITNTIISLVMTTQAANDTPSAFTGVNFTFPSPTSPLQINGIYSFNFTLGSVITPITSCNFVLLTQNGTTLATATTTFSTTYCSANITYNVTNYQTIVARGSYILNSTVRGSAYQSFVVLSYEVYTTNYSLYYFIQDVRSFNEAGFNDQSRMIVALIIILMITGYVTLKIGYTNEEGVIVLVIVLFWIFGYLSFFYLSSLNFFLSSDINEWLRNYVVPLLVTTLGLAYLTLRAR